MESTEGLPRARDFAQLLTEHGANWDTPFRDQPSFLAEAIRSHRADIAQILIQAGADANQLPEECKKELSTLDARSAVPVYQDDGADRVKL